jgi:hypothetical protein
MQDAGDRRRIHEPVQRLPAVPAKTSNHSGSGRGRERSHQNKRNQPDSKKRTPQIRSDCRQTVGNIRVPGRGTADTL